MGTKWKNAPVYFVLAQARFSPVLNLPSYLPAIQEEFRKAEFPDFKAAFNVTFNIGLLSNLKMGEEPPMQRNDRYLFLNETGTEAFTLDPNGLTYQTTAYKTSEEMFQTFLSRLESLVAILGLIYSDRVGLRYLDAVIPKDGEALESYLIPQVLGIRGRVAGDVQHSFTETLITVPDGNLLSRVVIQTGPIGLPPDLHLHPLTKFDARLAAYSGQYAIIDTDGFNDQRDKIDRSTIERKFRGLHKHVDAAFHSIVTKHAIKTWS